MARPKKNPEQLEPTKNTQAEIEAALAKASGGAFKPEALTKSPDPSPNTGADDSTDAHQHCTKSNDSEERPGYPKYEDDCKGDCICDEAVIDHCPTIKQFAKDCKNGNITAKDCRYWSSKNEDKSIMEYVKSINEKIYNETQNGSFSTEITFRVAPNDWVNVTKIIEWYESRGFEIRDHKINTPPPQYMNSGSMEHVFKIVWVNA